jgi:Hypothetical protein (DUF2513)
MKRDFDLVRKLLVYFEEKPGPEHIEIPPIKGYDELTIKYHLVLLHDAGLLRCEPVTSSSSDRVISVLPFELTWDGHEFLAKIRDDGLWRKTKDTILSKGGQLTFNTITAVATTLMKKMIDMA